MASYTFNPNGALDTGAELAAVTKKLEGSLSDLKVAIANFLNTNAGTSIENYDYVQAEWNQGQVKMELALAQGVVALNNIHDEYVLADNRGAATFGGTV